VTLACDADLWQSHDSAVTADLSDLGYDNTAFDMVEGTKLRLTGYAVTSPASLWRAMGA